jgi:hypothetical protein
MLENRVLKRTFRSKKDESEDGQKKIRSSIICTLDQILLKLSNQEGRGTVCSTYGE